MKNLISFSLLVFLLANATIGQVNLENTFNSNGFGTWHFNTGDETYYYNADASANMFYIFNPDYSVYKSIGYSPPSGYDLYYIYLVSDHLFNDDDLFEFILVFSNTTAYQMRVYNENMSLIKDLGNALSAYAIHTHDGYKLKTSLIIYDPVTQSYDYTDKIYSLPGELYVSDEGEPISTIEPQPYPNPSKNRVHLPYDLGSDEISVMRIYDLQGNLVDTKTIHGCFDRILLDVSTYKPGTYIYSYKDHSKRFVVQPH